MQLVSAIFQPCNGGTKIIHVIGVCGGGGMFIVFVWKGGFEAWAND